MAFSLYSATIILCTHLPKARKRQCLILNFSKKAACDTYEGMFGEVDIEQVCGLAQELSNIICGIC